MHHKKRNRQAPAVVSAPPQDQTVDLPPLSVRATVGSFDAEARTVSLIFSTGAPVERFDYFSGKRYLEQLEISPAAIDMTRLNSGAPLLDSHSVWSVADQLGAVVPGSARVEGGNAIATVKFSARDAVAPILRDVQDGIVTSVSVGYRVSRYEEATPKQNEIPVRTAKRWMPYEISLVSMPADTGARVRNGDKSETNTCVITRTTAGDSTMAKQAAKTSATTPEQQTREQSETLVERDPLDPGAPLDAGDEESEAGAEPNQRDVGVEYERGRVQGILNACRAARLPQSYADGLIQEGANLEAAQTRILEEIGKRDMASMGPRPGSTTRVMVGDDPLVHQRAGIMDALLHRVQGNWFPLTDVGRIYRGMSLLDTAKLYLQARGERDTGMTRMELAGAAFGLNTRGGGLHTTSDFANLLADVANKTLRKAYDEAPQTFTAIARKSTIPDFKMAKRLQLGDAPSLLAVDEHGEFTRGTMLEGKEQYQLATYGRVFGITRKALINDDTDAFSRIPMMFGRAARNLESNLVWLQILSNPTMGDGNALFSVAHANLSGTSDAISVASIGAGRAGMRKQTGLDSSTLVNVNPVVLIVPPAKETLADQFVSTTLMAQQSSNINPFAGKLQVIAEPRLEVGIGSTAGSGVSWYLAASPDQVDVVEYAYLEGEDGPMTESRVGFDVDGLEIKCRHDFGAKVLDWRGLWKNPGS